MPKIGNQKYSKSLYLGRQFENNVRTIRFDISEWVEEFGEGTVELLHMRHEDTVPYSVPISRIGNDVLWKVSSIDTAQAFSDGEAELRYYSENRDDYFLKSEVYRTVVSEALGTPLPEEDWYKSFVSKLNLIDDIVDEVTAIRDEILSSETGGVATDNNYTTADKNKLAGIEDGAEANAIVSVSVNDSPVEIVDKNISLRIPTKVSELTNDSGYLSEHQDISGKLDANKVGVSGGVAELDENGIIISAQLPSFVDDVLEYDSMSDFPTNGESGKIYVATNTNLSYRWSGSVYVEISPSIALGETSSTAYRGDRGKAAYEHSQATGNAHGMTKADIGLGNVPNVMTNDQTPTYTLSSTLMTLTSGEKLSIAFGKIAKGIYDLITHLSDGVKHITAAERTAWNNKVDKTSGKALSTNDYTTVEKNKLADIEEKATANAPATSLPNMDSTAAVGTSTKYAREDHVHPSDISRASADDVTALQAENAIFREYFANMDVYRTASGNPATFSDGYPANVKALSVTLTPTQSGSGAPYPPGGGPNLMSRESGTVWTSGTTNELTFTQTDNGILINGISGAGSSPSFIALRTTLEAGTYTLTGTPGVSMTDSVVVVYHAGTNATLAQAFADNVTFQLSEQTEVYVRVFAYGDHGTYSNFLVTCMLVRGTAAPSGYMPFANIRPISGVSSVSVTRTGENLMPLSGRTDAISFPDGYTISPIAGNGVSVSGTPTALREVRLWYPKVAISPQNAYRVTTFGTFSNVLIMALFLDAEGAMLAQQEISDASALLSIPANAAAVGFSLKRRYNNVAASGEMYPMLTLGESVPAAYAAPNPQTVSITLTDGSDPLTVYGGTLDVTTGELTVTHKHVKMSGLTWGGVAFDSDEYSPARIYFTSGITDMWLNPVIVGTRQYGEGVSDCFSFVAESISDDAPGKFSLWYDKSYNGHRVFVSAPNCANASEFKQWVTELDACVVYRLATPVTYQFTPAQLATLSGYNSVSADAGPVDVTYRSDISLV